MRKSALIAGALLLSGCGEVRNPDRFNADANDDGFITREEALAGFEEFEKLTLAPGQWKIKVTGTRADGEQRSKEEEDCMPADRVDGIRDELLADRYDRWLKTLPNEEADLSEFFIDGADFRIVVKKANGEEIYEGTYSPDVFKTKITESRGFVVEYSGERSGPCSAAREFLGE